jgi:DDE superfamily endonuclease
MPKRLIPAAGRLLRREPTQLIGEVRQPIPAKPGQIERYDCEYRRNGTANLFVFLDLHRSSRKVKVTERRAAQDFAACMRDLTDIHYPEAERIRVVLDNPSTHSVGALYQTFPADEARWVLRRLEFHHVPKHASWLNMVEIEIGVLASQCLDRRIESRDRLTAEIAIWEQQRNASGARIKGCSQPKRPAPKWAAPIRNRPTTSAENERVKTSVPEVLALLGFFGRPARFKIRRTSELKVLSKGERAALTSSGLMS